MKKLLTIALGSLFSITFFTQCKKEDQSKDFNANFYTSTANAQMDLYVDGVYKGALPYMSTVPVCGATPGDGVQPINMTLTTGSYSVVGKNAQGQVVSSSTVTIRKNGIGSGGNVGGNRVDSREDCLAIGLFE